MRIYSCTCHINLINRRISLLLYEMLLQVHGVQSSIRDIASFAIFCGGVERTTTANAQSVEVAGKIWNSNKSSMVQAAI